MVGFEISSTYAERFLYHLLHLNIIEYQPEFQVKIENARTIFEGCKMPMIVYTDEPAEKPASANRTSIHLNTPDAEALSAAQVPSRPTPSFTSQDQICLWGNSPSSSIKLTQETFQSLQSGHLSFETKNLIKALVSQDVSQRNYTEQPPSRPVGLESIMDLPNAQKEKFIKPKPTNV